MRICNRCGLDRPKEMWYNNFAWCKPCRKAWDKQHYAATKDEQIARKKRRWQNHAEWVRSQKEGPCTDCGVCYPPEIMEFDHLPGSEKSYTIANMYSLSKKRIQEEIDKCELVCPTCHALRTLERRGVG